MQIWHNSFFIGVLEWRGRKIPMVSASGHYDTPSFFCIRTGISPPGSGMLRLTA